MNPIRLVLFIAFAGIFMQFSCKRAEFVSAGVDCSLSFKDSSINHPKHQLYQGLIERYVREGLPGLVVLIKTPTDGLWIGASGYSDIERKVSMKPCRIMYGASVGKTYCAVAIMKLVEAGKLKLDDKINMYLSSEVCKRIPNGNSVTIRQLLAHRSGIPNFDDDPQFIADVLNNPFSIKTSDLIKYEYDKKALFSPGTDYGYSSTGYELLTQIIDRVSGENHVQYYQSALFHPLALDQTFYREDAKGLVNSYFDRLGDGHIEDISELNHYLTNTFTGSDGVMASVYDYAVFIESLMKGRVLGSNFLSQMTEWNPTSRSAIEYGLGLFRISTKYGYKIGHDGDAVGAAADVFYFPEQDITIVTATNIGTFLDSKLSSKYNEQFQEALLDLVFK